jgi:hypothetical protein
MRSPATTLGSAALGRAALPLVLSASFSASFFLGCSKAPEAPRGSPMLVEVHWVAGGKRTRIFPPDADAASPPRVSPYGNEVDFVFDRRLDGSRIEDIVGNTTVPKQIPPISVTWPGIDDPVAPVMSEPPFSHKVYYNSASLFGNKSSYAFVRPATPGFPSATAITFTLDRAAFTSPYGEPMEGPDQFTVELAAMTISPRAVGSTDAVETFPPSFTYPVTFSNRPATAAKLAPFAYARADGVELPVVVALDTVEKTVVFFSPAACLGGWPMGAQVEVGFAAGVPDAFGVASTTNLPAGSFRVSGASSPVDAACD